MKPVKVIRGTDLPNLMKQHIEQAKKDEKRFKDGGGICLKCGENPGEKNSQINPFNCKECNAEGQKALDALKGTPGFSEFRF
jgi:hypothetical protein